MSEVKDEIKDDKTTDPIVPNGEEGGEAVEFTTEEYNALKAKNEEMETKLASYEDGNKSAQEALEKLTSENVQIKTEYFKLAEDNPEYSEFNKALSGIEGIENYPKEKISKMQSDLYKKSRLNDDERSRQAFAESEFGVSKGDFKEEYDVDFWKDRLENEWNLDKDSQDYTKELRNVKERKRVFEKSFQDALSSQPTHQSYIDKIHTELRQTETDRKVEFSSFSAYSPQIQEGVKAIKNKLEYPVNKIEGMESYDGEIPIEMNIGEMIAEAAGEEVIDNIFKGSFNQCKAQGVDVSTLTGRNDVVAFTLSEALKKPGVLKNLLVNTGIKFANEFLKKQAAAETGAGGFEALEKAPKAAKSSEDDLFADVSKPT